MTSGLRSDVILLVFLPSILINIFVIFTFTGRAKNVWESPMGCLLLSFTVQMEDGHKLPLLQYVVSLAVTEAIKDTCQDKVIFSYSHSLLIPPIIS